MSERTPLTVAYRGNFSKPWCTEVHVAASLESLGHTVVRLQENTTSWATCVEAAAAAQVFLWTQTWHLDPEGGFAAMKAIREAGTPSAVFHLDRYVGLDRQAQLTEDPFWAADVAFTADGGHAEDFAALGINHVWSPPGVYDAECGIGKANKRRFPERVVFVGSHPYPHAEWRPYRDELLARLAAHLGRDFAVYPKVRNQPVRGRALADLYATAEIVIGDSCLSGDPPPGSYWSDRVPETVGRGAFLIHPEVAGMEEWYTDGEHLLTYPLGDWDNLLATVDKYLANPEERKAIAAAGQALVLSRDTYKHRMATVLDVLDEQFGIPEPRIPAPVSATVHAASDGPRTQPAPLPATRTLPVTPAPSRMTVNGRAALAAQATGLISVRHPRSRTPARFETTGGESSDFALHEVWTQDSYKLTQADVAGRVVLDIGANVGAFSVLAARMGAAHVHAYEPHPESYACLLANLERNGTSAQVTAHRQAVLGRSRSVVLVGAGGGAHIGGDDDGEQVPAVGIHEVLDAAGGTDLFIKMDIEGAEFDILAGVTAHDLHERVAVMVMENHGPGMPHLAHLDADGGHLEHWKAAVAMLADCGRLEIMGHPMVGGLMYWKRY